MFRTALAALALGGIGAAIWAALDVRGDVAASVPSRATDCRAPETAVSYRVTFVSTWSAQTHPESFPADAHYSGLHGATHHAGWSLWRPGGTATPGIERMAERGKSSPLKEEIREAVRAGHAGAEIRGDNLRRSPGSLGVDLRISREYPLVSLVAMLAPVTGDKCKDLGPASRKNRKLIECLQPNRRAELRTAAKS